MTPEQLAALVSVHGGPLTDAQVSAITPLLDSDNRQDQQIAAVLSQGRTRVERHLIGLGDVLGGLAPNGGAWLDAMTSIGQQDPNVKWAMKLIESNTLNVGHPATRALALAVANAAGGVVAQGVPLLLALAEAPDPIDVGLVSDALNMAEGRMPL